MKYRIACPCHFGLESVLSFEIKKIGGENINAENGKVCFNGDENTIAKANICLSTAERVLIQLAEFKAQSFEELFQGVKKISFENFISKQNAFPVKGYSLNSKLESVPACQSIIKKAIVERLKEKYKLNWLEESGSVVQIQFSIMKNDVNVYLDTSGEGLHKRGYRKNSNIAPIKETLAAGIIDLARVRKDSIVIDPFCGSGTLLIESAYKALNLAPNLKRTFSAEQWDCFNNSIWREERIIARENIIKDCKFNALGFDIDENAISLTEENAAKAGVKDRLYAVRANISNFKAQSGTITICNPPYGERMLNTEEAEKLYTIMGKVFPADKENPCYIISSNEEFEHFFGKKAVKRRKLYNGMMKCQLYMYF